MQRLAFKGFALGLAAFAFIAVAAGSAKADDWHYRHRDHARFHDDLDHRAFHRELDHREAHRYPMTWRQHGRLHDDLHHEEIHDRLEHRSYHRPHYVHRYYYGYPTYTPYRSYYYQPHATRFGLHGPRWGMTLNFGH